MILVCYNEEQDAFRFYDCALECWEDMIHQFSPRARKCSLAVLLGYGWEVVGEL
jgi:hypothetical protein